MPERPRVSLPFGGGLDRQSGPAVVQGSSFKDLRNVAVTEGWTSARLGLLRRNVFELTDATHIIGISKVRSQGVIIVLTYNDDDGTCEAWVAPGTLDTLDSLGTFWTIDPDAQVPPIVSLADSYDRLFIAHDEPDFALRQVTQVVDVVGTAVANLAPGGAVGSPKFRLVKPWLNYVIGVGWGVVGDENRPEIVRVSLAGNPLQWDKDHYFVCGQRGDPVIGLGAAGKVMHARKDSESYVLSGYSQKTFAVEPGDQEFGQAGTQLSVTVNKVNYFWSQEGPRVVEGSGESRDLSPWLALAGPAPSGLATNLDFTRGFAVYQPGTRDVRFIFGRWAFVLHLADEQRKRWSYAEYAVPLACGAIVPDTNVYLGPAETVFAIMLTATSTNSTISVNAEITAPGDLEGDETIEWWLLDPTSGVWARYATAAVLGALASYTYEGLSPGVLYTAAARVKRNGLAGHDYSSGIVTDWPASSRLSISTSV
jgi:hypothetical protein